MSPPPDSGPGAVRSPRRTLMIIAVVVVLAAAAAAIVVLVTRDDDTSAGARPGGSLTGAAMVTSFDGVRIDVEVTAPAGGRRHPLVVMPSSYSANKTEYAAIARTLTGLGFTTVSYSSRGFGNSGGSIDLAGSATQRDARVVIDWALQHTAADPDRVGMLGISYGAGTSLLTAAHDRRVRAVVALSTWTDLAGAFHPNNTLNGPTLGGLLTNKRTNSELKSLAAQLQADPVGNAGRFVDFAKSRSPSTYLARLNRNRPAIMLGNGWQDSLFPPTMLVDFYDKLTTPKRLQLSMGDHAGPEGDFLVGKRDRTGDSAVAWLQHYLAGQDNGIDKQRPVQLEDLTTKTVQSYSSWPRSRTLRANLAAPSTSGVAITTTPSTWQQTITVGQDTAAASASTTLVPGESYRAPTATLTSEPANDSMVWAAGPATRPTRVVGTPRLSVSVASSAPNASLFVYLYDTAPGGIGTLMTLTPLTVLGATETPKPVSVDLEPTDWTIATGHQLTIVVDTADFRWKQAAPAGATVTVSSSTAHPAQLRVPLG